MDDKIIKAIKDKIREADKLAGLDSRHPRFKAWHVSAGTFLKNLPPQFRNASDEFRKLNFEDTKYHRGKNFTEPAENDKFFQGIQGAKKILKDLAGRMKKQENQPPESP